MIKKEAVGIPAEKIIELKNALRVVEEAVKMLRESRQVDWDTMHAPLGPVGGLWPHERMYNCLGGKQFPPSAKNILWFKNNL